MTARTTIRFGVLGAVAVVSLSACGSGGNGFADKSAKTIVDAAVKDTTSLSSVTMSGTVTSDGKQNDIRLSSDTKGNCAGTLGIGGGHADVVATGGTSYIHGDEAFWRSAAGSAADQIIGLLGDKWAKLPGGAGFGDACDLDTMFQQLDDIKGTLSNGGTGKVGGKDAQEIISKKSGSTTHAWIATDGKHYLLKVEKTGDDAGTLTLSGFDEPVKADVPDAQDVVDLTSLG